MGRNNTMAYQTHKSSYRYIYEIQKRSKSKHLDKIEGQRCVGSDNKKTKRVGK